MEITEQKAQSLQMKMRSSELYSKERQLPTAFSKIARTSVKAGKTAAPSGSTPSSRENITATLKLIPRRVSFVIVEFHFAKMTGDRYLAKERCCALCKCCLSILLM